MENNIELIVSIMFKKYPSIKTYYDIILERKGEEIAKEYLSNCLTKYSLH